MSNNNLGINIYAVLNLDESDVSPQLEKISNVIRQSGKTAKIPVSFDTSTISNLQQLISKSTTAKPVEIVNTEGIREADREVNKLSQDINRVSSEFSTIFAAKEGKNTASIQGVFSKVTDAFNAIKALNLGKITQNIFADADNTARSFVFTIKTATGEVEKFRYAWEEKREEGLVTKPEGYYLQNIQESNAAVQRLIESQAKWNSTVEATKTKYSAVAESLKTLWRSSDGKNTPFFNQEHMERLSAQYGMLLGRIKELDGVTETDFANRKANIEAEITTIKALVAEYRSAERVGTVDPTKVETFNKMRSEFEAFQTKVQASGKGLFDYLSNDITALKASLDAFEQSKDKSSLYSFLDKLAEVKAKFSAQNDLANSFDTIAKKALQLSNSLNSLSGQDIFRKYTNDPSVEEFKGKITDISEQLNNLRNNVLNAPADKRSELLAQYIYDLERLTQEYNNAKAEAITFKNTLRDDTAVQRLIESQAKWNSTVEATKTKYSAVAESLKTLWRSSDGKNTPFFNQEHMERLSAQYGMLLGRIKELDGVTETDFANRKANIEAEITTIKALVAEYRSAERVGTSLRGVDPTKVETFNKMRSEFEAFQTKVQASGKGLFDYLSNDITALKASLDAFEQSKDKSSLYNFLDKLAEVKAKFSAQNDLANSFDTIAKKALLLSNSLNSLSGQDIFRKYTNDPSVEEFKGKITDISEQLNNLRNNVLNAPADKRSELLAQYIYDLERLTQEYNNAKAEAITFKNTLRDDKEIVKNRKDIQQLTAQITEYMNANTKAARKYGGDFQNILDGLKMPNIATNTQQIQALSTEFDALRTRINLAGDAGVSLGQRLATAVRGIPVVGMYLSINSLAMRAVRNIREMINTVVELDTSMTALKRVTNETATGYNNFLKTASKQAIELHSTITDLVDQTTTWVKLGNDLTTSSKLAEISMMYAKVGDVDTETAVKNLVSTMKAFNIEGEESIRIVDMLDKLNNEFAVTAADLGNGLAVTASAMMTAGNSLEQTLALLTGGSEITQNTQEFANALRVMSMRIRSMKGQLQDLGEEYENIQSLSKIQTQILNYTGVNIFREDGSFKETYEILKEISEVYFDLADTAKADLTEILFGKLRANQGIAVLQAFQSGQVQKAYEAATNSAGTATAEFEKWSESLEAHINSYKAAVQGLASATADDRGIRNLVDAGTALVTVLTDIISQFGAFQTIAPIAVAALSGFKNIGIFRTIKDDMTGATNQLALFGKTINQIKADFSQGYGIKALFNKPIISNDELAKLHSYGIALGENRQSAEFFRASFNGASSSVQILSQNILEQKALLDANAISQETYNARIAQMTAGTQGATVATNALNTALKLAFNVGIMFIISGIITAISNYSQKQKEAADNARKGAQEISDTVKSLDDYAEKITQLREELSKEIGTSQEAENIRKQLYDIQSNLIENYGLEKGAIDTVTDSVEKQIGAINRLKATKWSNYYRENSAEVDKAVKAIENVTVSFNPNKLFSISGIASNDETLRRLISTGTVGNIYETIEAFDKLQAELEDKMNDKSLGEAYRKSLKTAYDYLSQVRREQLKPILDNNESIYKSYVENSDLYSGEYKKLLNDRAAFETALEKGKQEDIDKTRKAYYQDYISFMNNEDKGYSSAAKKIFSDTFGDIVSQNASRYDLINKAILKQTIDNSKEFKDEYREFFNTLTDEELKAAANIDELFVDGVKGAYDKITAYIKNSPNALEPEDILPTKEEFEAEYNKRQHWLTMGQDDSGRAYTNDDFYAWLNDRETGYKHYFENIEEYQADYWKYEEEVFKWENEQAAERLKVASDLINKSKALASAFEEEAKDGSISAETALTIAENGYAAALMYDKETGKINLNRDAYIALADAELAKAEADLQSQFTTAQEQSLSAQRDIVSNLGWKYLDTAEAVLRLSEAEATISENDELAKALETRIQAVQKLRKELLTVGSDTGDDTGGTEKNEDLAKQGFDKAMKQTEHLHAMGLLADAEYYNELEKNNERYYKNVADHESDYLSNIEKIYNGRQKLYKEAADKELAELDKKLKLGYIKQEEYDKSLVALAEKYYGKGTTYAGTTFASENYQTLFDKSTENDQTHYKEEFEKVLNDLDKRLEKGIITVQQYRSEYGKLREEWWGAGSTWSGTTFASEMYRDMTDNLADVDKLYEEKLTAIQKANNGSIEAQQEYTDKWLSLIKLMYESSNPARFKEEYAGYANAVVDNLKDMLEKGLITYDDYISKVTELFNSAESKAADIGQDTFAEWINIDRYDERLEQLQAENDKSIESEREFVEKWKALNEEIYAGKDIAKYKTNIKDIVDYQLDLLEKQYNDGLISAKRYYSEVESLLAENDTLGKDYISEKLKDAWDIRVEEEQNYWKTQKELMQSYYDEQIKALESIQDKEEKLTKQRQLQLDLVKAQKQLEDAKKQKNQLIFVDGGFEYQADQDAIMSAEESRAKALQAIAENKLEEQIDLLKKQKETQESFYDKLLKEIEFYINKTVPLTESDNQVLSEIRNSTYAGYARDVSVGNAVPNNVEEINLPPVDSNAADGETVAELEGLDLPSDFISNISTAAKLLIGSDFQNLVEKLGGSLTAASAQNFVAGTIMTGNQVAKTAGNVFEKAGTATEQVTAVNRAINVGDIVVNLTMNVQNLEDKIDEKIQSFSDALGEAVKTEISRTLANV